MPFVYILRRADGAFVTGSTWNLSYRLRQHDSGPSPDDAGTPALVYAEWHERIDEAYYREREIHGWTHGQKRELTEARAEGERTTDPGQGRRFPAR